jgi:F0F1-type ATP synthase assembly protein I
MNNNDWWRPGILILTKVSASIAIPIVIALYLGKYLDGRYGTTPWIFLGLNFIAFIISLVSIWRSVKAYMKEIEEEEESEE